MGAAPGAEGKASEQLPKWFAAEDGRDQGKPMRRVYALCPGMLMVACLLPGPDQIREMNGRDRQLVREHASADLDCPIDELRVHGRPNSMHRISTWSVEGCTHRATYRVGDETVERVSPTL